MRIAAALLSGALLPVMAMPLAAQEARVSGFGRYAGYSKPRFDGHVRESRYVTVRDGTRLAVDVYRPTRSGRVAREKLPVVWLFTPYNRATAGPDGAVVPHKALSFGLLRHGYVLAIADVRGKGASFGIRRGPADANETNDAYDLTEWLAAQPWSSGSVGMTGCSYYGATALQAMKARPPHLKAVFAGTTTFDQYGTFAIGGIASPGLADDSRAAEAVLPVDADRDRHDWRAAMTLHARNPKTGRFFASTPYRDDVNPFTGDDWWRTGSFYPYLNAMNGGAALYLYGGYRDVFPDQTITHFLNAGPNTKLAFGDWPHCDTPGFAMDTERLRFFDYWLKGVRNGVMAEAPIHVEVRRAADGTEWRALPRWTDAAPRTRLYLTADALPTPPGVRGAIAPLVAGGMAAAPAAGGSTLVLAAPPKTLPSIVYGRPATGVDAYSVAFTLPGEDRWREIVGSSTLHLTVSVPASDVDLYAYLETVHVMGGVDIVARGALRASHRRTGPAPYRTDGVPWQTHARADAAPLKAGQPVTVDIPLGPTAVTLRPGDQLRVAITTRPPVPGDTPPPPLTLYLDAKSPAWIDIPDVDTRDAAIDPGIGTLDRPAMTGRRFPAAGPR